MKLVPMSKARYAVFKRDAIRGYAQAKVDAGIWDELDALDLAQRDHDALLPHGLKTSDHHLFELLVDGESVGVLWVHTSPDSVIPGAYIYDIEIDAEYYRMGYGRRAMLALEDWCAERKLRRIELNVFAANRPAIRLYEGLDYRPTNFSMQKNLQNS